MRTHPIERYQALRDSVPCLSRAATPPEGHQIGAGKRRAPGNTILSQPYRRRLSTDRLNCEGGRLAASLEGEPGPISAGKTLPHSYPEPRFWRERARENYTDNNMYCTLLYCVCVVIPFIMDVRLWTYQPGSHRRKVTQGFLDLLSAVIAFIFLARKIQPFLSLVEREVGFCVLTISIIVFHLLSIFFLCEKKKQFV